ncbi:MAG: cation transporter [Bacteroidetes bacterium]|nr:cation transporter [Bacteroidota bacterium]
MDCPSEENMIRMKLDGLAFFRLDFDIPNRNLHVYHEGDPSSFNTALKELNLGSSLTTTQDVGGVEMNRAGSDEKKLLWAVLLINFIFFAVEMSTGLFARSMGLVADSLDMLADAIVYALSLYAVGRATEKKKQIAKLSGYFQMTLAVLGLIEVIRRFLGLEQVPEFKTMIIVSLFALVGNALCLFLLQRSKSEEAHMKASMIFTSNDVIVNLGVIVAGVMVYLTDSRYPDLLIGSAVFVLVVKGAFRILKLSKA